jgi:hypothetical protein
MKELLRKFENLWVSVAFAEAGEHEASKEFLVRKAHDEGSPEIFQVA